MTARSRIFSLQVDNTSPNWVSGRIKTNLLEDEAGFLQYGQTTEETFLDFHMATASTPSSWITFPTEDKPSNKFKYTSMEIKMSLDLVTWSRQTYSLLDWLGDLGGLFDALWYIASLVV